MCVLYICILWVDAAGRRPWWISAMNVEGQKTPSATGMCKRYVTPTDHRNCMPYVHKSESSKVPAPPAPSAGGNRWTHALGARMRYAAVIPDIMVVQLGYHYTRYRIQNAETCASRTSLAHTSWKLERSVRKDTGSEFVAGYTLNYIENVCRETHLG
jgi:hypothetical protein